MESTKLVLITGSNKGIGYGIIENLLEKHTKLRLIMTARNDEVGQATFARLTEKYPDDINHIYYHQLDITKEDSIKELIAWIKQTFNKIDYIVNNAGVSSIGTDFNLEVFEKTFEVNVYGTISFTEMMLKGEVMNKSGKVIIIGSSAGTLSYLSNDALISQFKNAKTVDDLYKLSEKFKQSVINETVDNDGWCRNTFKVSKMIANTYARVLSQRKEILKDQMSVYSGHPGWVKTDMGGNEAPLSIKEGCETPIFLIELPDGINKEYQGKYFTKCKVSTYDIFPPEK